MVYSTTLASLPIRRLSCGVYLLWYICCICLCHSIFPVPFCISCWFYFCSSHPARWLMLRVCPQLHCTCMYLPYALVFFLGFCSSWLSGYVCFWTCLHPVPTHLSCHLNSCLWSNARYLLIGRSLLLLSSFGWVALASSSLHLQICGSLLIPSLSKCFLFMVLCQHSHGVPYASVSVSCLLGFLLMPISALTPS